ncbi:cytidylyltransferase domain-containing protein [Amycolatopsis sp. NPDC049868]|uniref:acylneuraminate cytidylyltransferase family protein n=1 Tax=Amycolatopsis sp. NPDC049868 TaxID=3363934 RepID=UPI0037AECEE5
MRNKTAAIIPVKRNSTRSPGKNTRPLGGQPLAERLFSKCSRTKLDAVFVDTDDPNVVELARGYGFDVIPREPWLATDEANGNDLIVHHAAIVDADLYFQLFVTAPFLRPETIDAAIDVLATGGNYDSVFTAIEIYTWFWFDGKPVNYDPKELPRSQDARPIVQETTALYGITAEALRAGQCRIGEKPYPLLVDQIEALDIDTDLDFELAEYYEQRAAP